MVSPHLILLFKKEQREVILYWKNSYPIVVLSVIFMQFTVDYVPFRTFVCLFCDGIQTLTPSSICIQYFNSRSTLSEARLSSWRCAVKLR
jgi:hypothetical protein